MKYAGTIDRAVSVAMSAGGNTLDITVPAGHTFELLDAYQSNPDVAARYTLVVTLNAGGTHAQLVRGYEQIPAAVNGSNLRRFDSDNGVGAYITDTRESIIVKAGGKIRFSWYGMTGSNTAVCSYRARIYRDESAGPLE